jgi:hypothetical protein
MDAIKEKLALIESQTKASTSDVVGIIRMLVNFLSEPPKEPEPVAPEPVPEPVVPEPAPEPAPEPVAPEPEDAEDAEEDAEEDDEDSSE